MSKKDIDLNEYVDEWVDYGYPKPVAMEIVGAAADLVLATEVLYEESPKAMLSSVIAGMLLRETMVKGVSI